LITHKGVLGASIAVSGLHAYPHTRRSLKQRKDLDRAAWRAAHPPGYIEYRDAIGPNGRYGKWLRAKPVLVEIGVGARVHAPVVLPWRARRSNPDHASLR